MKSRIFCTSQGGEERGGKCPMGVTSTLMGGFKKNHVTWDGGGAPSTMGTLVIIDPKVLGLEKPNTSYHIFTLHSALSEKRF